MVFLLLFGWVVKNGWAKRSGSGLVGAASAGGAAFFTPLFFFEGIKLVLMKDRMVEKANVPFILWCQLGEKTLFWEQLAPRLVVGLRT